MVKRLIALALSAILAFLMTACFAVDPDMAYVGNYPELSATAIYSIVGTESSREDTFLILEEDQYGRVLFAAYLPDGSLINSSFYDGILAVIIMQGHSNSSAWFYCEKNYIARIVETKVDLNEEIIEQYFSEDEIVALKEANDWNGATDEKESLHVPLSAEKDEVLSVKMRKQIEEVVGSNIRYSFFRANTDGTKVFFVLNISDTMPKYTWYLIAFDDKDALIKDVVTIIEKDLEKLPSAVDSFLGALNILCA